MSLTVSWPQGLQGDHSPSGEVFLEKEHLTPAFIISHSSKVWCVLVAVHPDC